ncbi:MAG: peptidase M48 [Cyanothece sp. SIO1E1]|nr:peptidase M48 [Cyanothece sp. SIO1E1]
MKLLKLAVIACFSTTLFTTQLEAQAKTADQAFFEPPTDLSPDQPQNHIDETDEIYSGARAALSEADYVLYRIIDRVARANGLTTHPWHVAVVPAYDSQAFATQANLLAIYSGLLDEFRGDVDALACIVSREMSRHINHHIALNEAEKAAIYKRLRTEAEAEAQATGRKSTAINIGGVVARTVGNVFGDFGRVIGGVAEAVLVDERNRRLQSATARVEEIYAVKATEIEQQWAQARRNQELEADEFSYQYAVQAGFQPQGCFRAINALSRLTDRQTSDLNQPTSLERLERLTTLRAQYPGETLASKGRLNLAANSHPLTYTLSENGSSLRVNSQYDWELIDSRFPR